MPLVSKDGHCNQCFSLDYIFLGKLLGILKQQEFSLFPVPNGEDLSVPSVFQAGETVVLSLEFFLPL
jgi:hypothetical protein